jgi:hypothetical protein
MNKFFSVKISLLSLAALSAHGAFAWGVEGHRIVAEIAQRHLTPTARARVEELLGSQSLPRVSTWADEVRSNHSYDYMKTWHYTSVEDGQHYAQSEKAATGDVVTAIVNAEDKLRDTSAAKNERVEALKMLVHFIGDLHQPLHVGRKDDEGGNRIRVEFFGQSMNLHHVWDSGLIDRENLSYTEFADFLDHASAQDLQTWSHDTLTEWTDESVALRSLVYDFSGPDSSAKQPVLGYEYRDRVIKPLEQRLLQAGIRLAARLNALLAP